MSGSWSNGMNWKSLFAEVVNWKFSFCFISLFEFIFGGQYISGAFLKFSFSFVSTLALKKVFAEHKDIQKLAEKFILLNLVVSFPATLN